MHSLRVGGAQVDITPPLPCMLAGYPHRDPAKHINDEIYARALVMANSSTQVCILALDLCWIEYDSVARIRRGIAECTKIPEEHIVITVSHTHCGPNVSPDYGLYSLKTGQGPILADNGYMRTLERRIITAAQLAQNRSMPASVGAATGSVADISGNRRIYIDGEMRMYGKKEWHSYAPEADPDYAPEPIDPEVGVIKVGQILLFNFTAHALAAGASPFVSADYPGTACQVIQRALGNDSIPIFLQGTCGNVHPKLNDRPRSYEEARRKGRILAYEVLKTCEHIEMQSEISLKVKTVPVELPYRSSGVDVDELYASYEDWLNRFKGAPVDTPEYHRAAIYCINAYRDYAQWKQVRETGRSTESSQVTVLRINDIGLVFLPGEVFVELGLEIKRNSPLEHTFVVGYSHGTRHYVPTRQAFEEGGYESTYGTVFAAGCGELLVDTAISALKEISI
jgi:neutral ceramidase